MNDVFYFLDFFSINVMEIIPIWKSSIGKKMQLSIFGTSGNVFVLDSYVFFKGLLTYKS